MGLGSDRLLLMHRLQCMENVGLLRKQLRCLSICLRGILVSWNSMIYVFSENGVFRESFSLFREMLESEDCLIPDVAMLVTVLPVCAAEGEVELGKLIHGLSVKLELNKEVCSKKSELLSMKVLHGYSVRHGFQHDEFTAAYAKCGSLTSAEHVFNTMKIKTVSSWNALIGGFEQNGDPSRL